MTLMLFALFNILLGMLVKTLFQDHKSAARQDDLEESLQRLEHLSYWLQQHIWQPLSANRLNEFNRQIASLEEVKTMLRRLLWLS
jgi:hypothetical protein